MSWHAAENLLDWSGWTGPIEGFETWVMVPYNIFFPIGSTLDWLRR